MPNDAFFVRYHLAGIPEEIDAAQWKLKVGGEGVGKPLELSLSDMRSSFDSVELAAVCQCSGNRRGFSDPHVAGVQWELGAVGNALWKGVRLKDVLNRANVRAETIEIVVNGADGPVLDATPDFIKSLPLEKALDDNTLIAYEMNGAPIPHYNGFPIRLIVPGWTATYWMKHLDTIEAWTKPFAGFWMKSAYRIPSGKFPIIQRFQSQITSSNEPITEMVVNSMITAPEEGHTMRTKETAEVRGLRLGRRLWRAPRGNLCRRRPDVARGRAWQGFRSLRLSRLSLSFHAAARGQISGDGESRQWRRSNSGRSRSIFNPAGYHNNVVRPLTVNVL